MITRKNGWQVTLTVTWLVLQLVGRHPFKRRLKAICRKGKQHIAFSYSTMIALSWYTTEELRCLFVREGEYEYLRRLLRYSCSWMHNSWDTHRWDWVCLNIIHSGWESLSRIMWRGYSNVNISPLSVVSLGKSSQSIHIHFSTSHYQCAWSGILELECSITHLNGSQFRQV